MTDLRRMSCVRYLRAICVVTLGTVAQDGHFFVFDQVNVAIAIVINAHLHVLSLMFEAIIERFLRTSTVFGLKFCISMSFSFSRI